MWFHISWIGGNKRRRDFKTFVLKLSGCYLFWIRFVGFIDTDATAGGTLRPHWNASQKFKDQYRSCDTGAERSDAAQAETHCFLLEEHLIHGQSHRQAPFPLSNKSVMWSDNAVHILNSHLLFSGCLLCVRPEEDKQQTVDKESFCTPVWKCSFSRLN